MSLPSQPSAADVARKAGVSRTQVSYVLNNRRIEHVSEENRRKIQEAARELGYYPQQSGQALRRGYANQFALFFPAPYSYRINAMLGVIHERGLADGCVPVQYSFPSYGDAARKKAALRALVATKPRGLFCSLFDVTEDDLEEARDRGIGNIVVYDVGVHPLYPTLVLPVGEVGFLGIRSLLEKGHRRIGILRPSDPVAQRGYFPRLAGARRAVDPVPGAELVELAWPAEETRPSLRFAAAFLDSAGLPGRGLTALYAHSDEYALPLLTVLLDRGVRVPDQLALLGTDDVPYGAMVRPGLSTIRFDQDNLGGRVVALINTVLEGREPEAGEAVPAPVLVVRQTT